MITDEQAREMIDPWVYEQLNHSCPYCGSKIYNSSNLRTRKCGNPRCYHKLAEKADYMLKDLGIKGIGVKTLERVITSQEMVSIFEIFIKEAYKNIRLLSSQAEMKVEALSRQRFTVQPYKIVEYLGIDGIGKESAYALMKNVKNQFDPLPAQLQEYKVEIALGWEAFNVKVIQGKLGTYNVMLTNSIQGYSNRKGFITYLNNKYGEKFEFKEVGAVSRANVLVADTLNSSSKELYCRKNGIPIMSSKLFESKIKERYWG